MNLIKSKINFRIFWWREGGSKRTLKNYGEVSQQSRAGRLAQGCRGVRPTLAKLGMGAVGVQRPWGWGPLGRSVPGDGDCWGAASVGPRAAARLGDAGCIAGGPRVDTPIQIQVALAGLGFAYELACVGLARSGHGPVRGCSGLRQVPGLAPAWLEPIGPELHQKGRARGKIPPR